MSYESTWSGAAPGMVPGPVQDRLTDAVLRAHHAYRKGGTGAFSTAEAVAVVSRTSHYVANMFDFQVVGIRSRLPFGTPEDEG